MNKNIENTFPTDKDLLHKCFIKYVTLMNDFLNYSLKKKFAHLYGIDPIWKKKNILNADVFFEKYIREEKKFDSIEKLINQLELDKRKVLKLNFALIKNSFSHSFIINLGP